MLASVQIEEQIFRPFGIEHVTVWNLPAGQQIPCDDIVPWDMFSPVQWHQAIPNALNVNLWTVTCHGSLYQVCISLGSMQLSDAFPDLAAGSVAPGGVAMNRSQNNVWMLAQYQMGNCL